MKSGTWNGNEINQQTSGPKSDIQMNLQRLFMVSLSAQLFSPPQQREILAH